jgi:hypothetical protein
MQTLKLKWILWERELEYAPLRKIRRWRSVNTSHEIIEYDTGNEKEFIMLHDRWSKEIRYKSLLAAQKAAQEHHNKSLKENSNA